MRSNLDQSGWLIAGGALALQICASTTAASVTYRRAGNETEFHIRLQPPETPEPVAIERLFAQLPEYDPGERRDPFVRPAPATAPGSEEERPEGLAGTLVGEVRVSGISRFGGEPQALLIARDGNAYLAREGARLWNGSIDTIDFDAGAVLLLEKVEDPGAASRLRTVERLLDP